MTLLHLDIIMLQPDNDRVVAIKFLSPPDLRAAMMGVFVFKGSK